MSRRDLWTASHFSGVTVAAGAILYGLLLQDRPEPPPFEQESHTTAPARPVEDEEVAVMRAALRFTMSGPAVLVDQTVECPTTDPWGWGHVQPEFKPIVGMPPRLLRGLALREDSTRFITLDERSAFTEQAKLLAISRVLFAPDRSTAWVYTMWDEPSELVPGGRDRSHGFSEMRKGNCGWYPATTEIWSDPAAREYWVRGWTKDGG